MKRQIIFGVVLFSLIFSLLVTAGCGETEKESTVTPPPRSAVPTSAPKPETKHESEPEVIMIGDFLQLGSGRYKVIPCLLNYGDRENLVVPWDFSLVKSHGDWGHLDSFFVSEDGSIVRTGRRNGDIFSFIDLHKREEWRPTVPLKPGPWQLILIFVAVDDPEGEWFLFVPDLAKKKIHGGAYQDLLYRVNQLGVGDEFVVVPSEYYYNKAFLLEDGSGTSYHQKIYFPYKIPRIERVREGVSLE